MELTAAPQPAQSSQPGAGTGSFRESGEARTAPTEIIGANASPRPRGDSRGNPLTETSPSTAPNAAPEDRSESGRAETATPRIAPGEGTAADRAWPESPVHPARFDPSPGASLPAPASGFSSRAASAAPPVAQPRPASQRASPGKPREPAMARASAIVPREPASVRIPARLEAAAPSAAVAGPGRRGNGPGPRPATAPEERRIEVKIGRVEIRANQPAPQPVRAPASQGERGFAELSLRRAYLDRDYR